MATYISIVKEYEDALSVTYSYNGGVDNFGSFKLNKINGTVLEENINGLELSYLRAVSKIIKIINSGNELPNATCYAS